MDTPLEADDVVNGNVEVELEPAVLNEPAQDQPQAHEEIFENELNGQENEQAQVRDDQYQLARDKVRRVNIGPPTRFAHADFISFAFMAGSEILTEEPRTVREALTGKDKTEWKLAMQEEIDSLAENKTWELVPTPTGQKLVGSKWIFKLKEGIPGVEKPRFKARLVAKGFTQRKGIDYNEIYSLMDKHRSIRTILALTAHFDWELEQLDVKTAFLYGDLKKQIYMKQP